MRFPEFRGTKTIVVCTKELNTIAKSHGLKNTVNKMTVGRWDKGENMPHIDWWPIIEKWSNNAITVSDLQEAYLEHKRALAA